MRGHKMKFEILETKKGEQYFEISANKECLKTLKTQKDDYKYFSFQ